MTAATRPSANPVFDDRSLLGHPKGLGLLFIVEMWERFSYYGMRALLVLFMVNAQHWTTERAANLYGTYGMLVYLTPLIGGYLADRFIGTRRSLVIGSIVIAAGHFTLALEQTWAFYLGLGLIIVGTGFFKPNASTMVGQIYREGDPRRDSGYTIYYMGVNLGAFLGPLLCGYLAQSPNWGWSYGFAAAGVGMVMGLMTYMWGRNRYLPGIGMPERTVHTNTLGETVPAVNPAHAITGAITGVVVAWAASGFATAFTLNVLLGILMGGVVGAALFATLLGTHGEERKCVIAIFVMAFFVIFFWAAYEQAGSSMNLFADKNTDLTLGGIFPLFGFFPNGIPSSWFQSLNPLMILIFAPIFAGIWVRLGKTGKEPSTPIKMVLGMVLLGIGFLFMVAGAKASASGVKVSALWLTGAYSLHTFGELCLSPIGLSYVSKISPPRFAGLLMGVWFLANAAANKLAGALAGQVDNIQPLSKFYTIFVISSLVAAVVMFCCVPFLKKLTASVKA